ncbi:MAG: helix-turn-helix domain-containing protein [Candidatus Nomurabacteria bacterium]
MENENLDIKKSLEYIGFSEKEVVVYLALLSLGKGTVTEISRKAGINRPTGYHVLASLSIKELVKVSGKEPKQEYIAESPDQIEKLLQNRIEEDQRFINEAKKIIPELKSIHNVIDRPKIFFYEGTAGLEKVYEDTLTSHEPIRGYATVDDMHKGLPNYFPEYYKRRAKAGIAIRAIIPKTEIGVERSSHDKEELREMAFVPADKYYFSPEIDIYDNKVMIASWREKLGIIIESAEIADAMKKIYELAWAEAKRLDKEI